MTRDEKFGRLLAIADVLSDGIFEKHSGRIGARYSSRMSTSPTSTIMLINRDIIQYVDTWGEREHLLYDMFTEILADMSIEEFDNEPLSYKYLHSVSVQRHALRNIMSVEEAAKKWKMSESRVRALCADETIEARKLGKTWIIPKDHPHPKEQP
jgi:hypothetical protein